MNLKKKIKKHDFVEKVYFLKKQILKKKFAQKKSRFDPIDPLQCAYFSRSTCNFKKHDFEENVFSKKHAFECKIFSKKLDFE